MAMDINEMKEVFLTGEKEKRDFMLDYIRTVLNVSDADWYSYCGYYVISVPPENYEFVLARGKEFAAINNMSMYWLDCDNIRRAPISSCDIGYCVLPDTLIPGEEKKEYSNRFYWEYFDDRTPKTILEYLESMRAFLKTDKIYRTYNGANNFIISASGLDYETESELFQEFVQKYGYGPFEKIYSLSFTGKLIKPPILSMKEQLEEENTQKKRGRKRPTQ